MEKIITIKANLEKSKELSNILDILENEKELHCVFTILKKSEFCTKDLGAYECHRLGIKREGILNSILAIYKNQILKTIEKKGCDCYPKI